MELKMLLPMDLQWFAQDGPGGEKTEPATAKKLEDARKDGKVSKSKELIAGVDLLVLFLVLKVFTGNIYQGFIDSFQYIYGAIPSYIQLYTKNITIDSLNIIFLKAAWNSAYMLLPFMAIGFAVTLLLGIIQVGWRVTTKPLMPELNKFNPISGFKRILSKDSIFELFKSIAKLTIITLIAYFSIRKNEDTLFVLYDIPLVQAVILCGEIIIDAGIKISIAYLFLGITDFVYQKHKFNEEMKMTKQEIKDELKNTEGNPEIKGRQRQRMREASQRRMMQDVPKADVIITNPTHLAVAVKYDALEAKAPIVIAKGEDHLALKIREVAKEHQIEIVENKPLARMLYANVDIGKEIPQELYQAVAEVLAMVYNIKNK